MACVIREFDAFFLTVIDVQPGFVFGGGTIRDSRKLFTAYTCTNSQTLYCSVSAL